MLRRVSIVRNEPDIDLPYSSFQIDSVAITKQNEITTEMATAPMPEP